MESTRQNNSINAINNARMLLIELRSNLSREETKRIRDKLYKKEAIYNFLKEKGSLTNKEKKVLKSIDRYPKNISMHLKNLKKHFKKLQKYQYGIDYLFNEHIEEDYTSNNNINATKDARELLNEHRSNLSHEETKRIRKKLRRIEAVNNVLKKKEQKGSLTSRQKNMLRNDERYLKNISMHLKNLTKHFKKLQKYQYGLDYLFNEHNEEDYTTNNDINVFKDARKLLNEHRSNLYLKKQMKLEKNFIKKKLPTTF